MTAPQSVIVAAQVLSFFAIISQIPVLIIHGRLKNVGVVCLSLYLIPFNIMTFIAAWVWGSDNVDEWWSAEVFGDIYVRYTQMASCGIMLSTACIARGLAIVLSEEGPTIDPHSFQRRMVDLAICTVFPLLNFGLCTLSCNGRYLLLQYYGPMMGNYNTALGLVVYIVPPLVCSLVCIVYTVLAVYRYLRKRRDFKDLLHTTNSGMTTARFVRFMVFAVIATLYQFPLALYAYIVDIQIALATQLQPFTIESFIKAYPIILRSNADSYTDMQWVYISVAYIIFACFGTNRSIYNRYVECANYLGLAWLKRKLHARRGRISAADLDNDDDDEDRDITHHTYVVREKDEDKDRTTVVETLARKDSKGSEDGLLDLPEMLEAYRVNVKIAHHKPAVTTPPRSLHSRELWALEDDEADDYNFVYGASAKTRQSHV